MALRAWDLPYKRLTPVALSCSVLPRPPGIPILRLRSPLTVPGAFRRRLVSLLSRQVEGPMHSSRLSVMFVLAVALLAVAPGLLPAYPDRSAAAPIEITITSAGFEPADLTIDVGTELVWRNTTDQTLTVQVDPSYRIFLPLIVRSAVGGASVQSPASAVSASGAVAASPFGAITPGGTWRLAFDRAGLFEMLLQEIPGLRGRITVRRPTL
jgi:plastocyanin